MSRPGDAPPLSLLWRGPLDSCNYGCAYCPFAKRRARPEVLAADRAALTRFTDWALAYRRGRLSVLFTPWGEGLVHGWYRAALTALSHAPHIDQVAIQTNGSTAMEWTAGADRSRLALWITWHPTEIGRERFLAQVGRLTALEVRFSVGCVALPAHLELIEGLRRRLPPGVPLWLNAQRPGGRYDAEQVARFTAIDPRFPLDLRAHPSGGRACATGDTVLAVDGDGDLRRCHFVDRVLGNLYRDDLDTLLRPRSCPRSRCDCFIGYAHLEHLDLRAVYGDGLLARIPRAATLEPVEEPAHG